MIKNIFKIIVGLFMIAVVLIGYIPQPEYLVELTCVSNMLGGLLLLLDGVLNITKKKAFPNAFYMNITVSILYYIIFVNEQDRKVGYVLKAPIMIMAYVLFDYIHYQFTGEFVYGFINSEKFTLVYAIIAGIVIYVLMYLLSLILFVLNRLVHKIKW